MADETPPPYAPPLADEAPPFLASFIYYLTRDFMPFGAIEYALARARERTDLVPAGPCRDFAELTARELAYKSTPVPE